MTSKAPPVGPRVLEGVQWNLLGQGAVLAANLLITPYLVARLGSDGYGLYTLMWTLAGYLMVLNFGTVVAVQKFCAQHLGCGPGGPLGGLLRRTLAFELAMALIGGALLWSARAWISGSFLKISPELAPKASSVFAFVAASAAPYFALQFALNVLYGTQRFKAWNLLTTLQSLAVSLCALALLSLGHGIRAVAASFLFSHAALAAAGLWLVRDTLLQKSRPDPRENREFIRFSGKSLASYLMWIVTFQGDRVFIGSLLPLSQIGFYAVSSTLAQKFNMLCGAVTAAAFPLLTELHGRGEEERLRRLYLKGTELSLFLILPISVLSFALAPQFMTLWLGADFSAASTWPFRLLVLANLAYLATYLPNSAAIGRGFPELSAYLMGAKALVVLLLWPLVIPRWGILGAAAGLLAAEWLVVPVFLTFVHRRHLGLTWAEFLDQGCRRPFLSALVLAAVSLAFHGQVQGWAGLLCFGGAGLALYWGAGYAVMEENDRRILRDWSRAKLSRGRSA